MATTTVRTAMSALIAQIATSLGWVDESYYGDTDYGLTQKFVSPRRHRVLVVKYGPDGRLGTAENILGIEVSSDLGSLFFQTDTAQSTMRAAVIFALSEYGDE